MEVGLVSVVLPIYNVEKYLNRCIESVGDLDMVRDMKC